MKSSIIRMGKLLMLIILLAGLSACDEPQVYGSVGISSYGGGGYYGHRGYYGGGPRMGGSIRIGGRIH